MAAFDKVAARYDAEFSHQHVAHLLRQAVRTRLMPWLPVPPGPALELGCGSGEDAGWLVGLGYHLLTTDASPAMLAITAAKLRATEQEGCRAAQLTGGLGGRRPPRKKLFLPPSRGKGGRGGWATQTLNLNHPPDWAALPPTPFHLAFANFGVLNCVADLPAFGQRLSAHLAPGALVALIVMAPTCLWEIGYHLLRGQPRTAFRRLRPGGSLVPLSDGTRLPVWYPSPARLRAALAPTIAERACLPIGLLLPPPYLERHFAARPALTYALARLEAQITAPAPAQFADHYLWIGVRR